MDTSQNVKEVPVLIPIKMKKEKPEKPWKFAEVLDGKGRKFRMLLFGKHRMKPNKYTPGNGKKLSNEPHCLGVGSDTANCRACMWRFRCRNIIEGKIK